ncbi:baseplate J/gp47 family protein [Entomohabitans teleogrylli]|uniref:baseplate J/gp47 family protein n=1 Tax=Entomohabitans teleogrylli TaxID=1384589 RepID=UPI00073D42F5|nr:baseplate J/gp47 family protein [Entomohabitans teleogrylli]
MAELYNYVDSTGAIVPDTADIKSDIEREFKSALGENMSTADDTPQGRLIAGETSARRAVAENNALLANQVNPDLATGIFLESICAWLGIERKAESVSTIASVTLGGIPLVEIPTGSRARSVDGDLYMTTRTIVLDSAGRGKVDFVALETGALVCPVGGLTTIVDSVLGWETIHNDNAAIPGDAPQSDEALRLQRELRLAGQGTSTVEAQISNLYAVAGVKSLTFLENISHEYQTIEGVVMKPHSVWACVHGGTDDDIAMSLLNNKTAGAGWNGKVSVSVTEPNASIPYTVLFDRPTEVPIRVEVSARQGQSTVSLKEAIVAALMRYASGEIEGEHGFVTGMNVSPFELSGAINIIYPGIFIRNILIARDDQLLTASELEILKNEIPVLEVQNISVVTG